MGIVEQLIVLFSQVISLLGYWGIFILMIMESMVLPVPSEAVMPFAGYLVAVNGFNLWIVTLVATLGTIVGSMISYYIGYHGGNPLVRKFGKYLFLNEGHLKMTEKWFSRQGEKTIFISRFVPVVRHFISIPAGIGKMHIPKFIFYTFTGAFIWNLFLAWVGFVLGENWTLVHKYSAPLDYIVAGLLVIVVFIYFYRASKRKAFK